MGVHIVLLVLVSGILILWKAGWLRLEVLNEKKGRRLFAAVALSGNLFGFLVTLGTGTGVIYSDGHRMEKSEDGAYEEKFFVSIDGQETAGIYVQVP